MSKSTDINREFILLIFLSLNIYYTSDITILLLNLIIQYLYYM